jgi:hypothetical protein
VDPKSESSQPHVPAGQQNRKYQLRRDESAREYASFNPVKGQLKPKRRRWAFPSAIGGIKQAAASEPGGIDEEPRFCSRPFWGPATIRNTVHSPTSPPTKSIVP